MLRHLSTLLDMYVLRQVSSIHNLSRHHRMTCIDPNIAIITVSIARLTLHLNLHACPRTHCTLKYKFKANKYVLIRTIKMYEHSSILRSTCMYNDYLHARNLNIKPYLHRIGIMLMMSINDGVCLCIQKRRALIRAVAGVRRRRKILRHHRRRPRAPLRTRPRICRTPN